MEKLKTAFQSFWSRIKPSGRKYGDLLLFALALAVLAAILINRTAHKVITQTAPSIVFTQWWQDNLEKDTLKGLAEEFESLHRDIKIIIKDRAYEDLRNDLFNPSEDFFSGDVLALDPLWVPELLKSETIEQGNDALFISFINVLFYNIEILLEAEFTRPPKNRSEFTDYLRTIAAMEKNYHGFALDTGSSRGIYDDIFPWIWSSGAQLITDGKPTLNSRQVTDSLSFLSSLYKEGSIFPGYGNKIEDFISGRTAFMIAPSGSIASVRERMGDEAFSVSSIPTPDNYAGKTFSASAAWTIGINAASAHKEEAQLFASFLADKASYLSGKAHAIPGTGNAPYTPDPFYSKVWDIAIAAEPAQDFTGLPWIELEKIFREELNAMFAGNSTPAETAAAIQEKLKQ